MSYLNEMQAFAHEQGLLGRIIPDGKLRRANTVERPNSLEAWLVAYPNHLTIGNWRTGMKYTWRPQGNSLTHQDKEELRLARLAYKAEIAKKQLEAAKVCESIWHQTILINENPYLTKKQIQRHIARMDRFNNLVVPVSSFHGKLMSLQFIPPKGEKRFKSGGVVSGNAAMIGSFDNTGTLLVCEGYATGCSLHEATNLPVVVAFNAGNLEAVCKTLSLAHPTFKLVLCADNDHQTERKTGINVGLDKARIIAEKLNVLWLWPEFEADNQGSDFNDIHCQHGLQALTNLLIPAINGGY